MANFILILFYADLETHSAILKGQLTQKIKFCQYLLNKPYSKPYDFGVPCLCFLSIQ